MKKKTLREKINIVCWWAVGLTVVYFIIGVILKSDGPKFDPIKTYDLIKDTLTLTATFLAPVAAFVLFSDWREEHKIKSLLSLMDSIKNTTKEIEGLLVSFKSNIENRIIEVNSHYEDLNDLELVIGKLTELSFLYRELEDDSHDLTDYKKLIDNFYKQASYLKTVLHLTEQKSVIVKSYESLNSTRGGCDQIYPIPEKDLYEKNIKDFVKEMGILEMCLNDLISETKKIKKNI